MDLAILSAASALAGSMVGGAATLGASWLTLRGQLWHAEHDPQTNSFNRDLFEAFGAALRTHKPTF